MHINDGGLLSGLAPLSLESFLLLASVPSLTQTLENSVTVTELLLGRIYTVSFLLFFALAPLCLATKGEFLWAGHSYLLHLFQQLHICIK